MHIISENRMIYNDDNTFLEGNVNEPSLEECGFSEEFYGGIFIGFATGVFLAGIAGSFIGYFLRKYLKESPVKNDKSRSK
jgi:hypothetical protein